VDIFQPCVTFNDLNTYAWFREHTRPLEDHDTGDLEAALRLAGSGDPLYTGIFYQTSRPAFPDNSRVYQNERTPLFKRSHPARQITEIMEKLK